MKDRLIKALIKCAKSHKVKYKVYDEDKEDVQVVLFSTSIPVVADMQTIAESFYGRYSGIVYVDYSWGYSDFLTDNFPMLKNVNTELLKLALPYGTKI